MQSNTKTLILNPKDGISDIIYQIKSDVVKKNTASIFIPTGMHMLYNNVNRGLFISIIQQLEKYKLELFSDDINLIQLLDEGGIQVQQINSSANFITPHIPTEELDLFTNLFPQQAENLDSNDGVNVRSKDLLFNMEPTPSDSIPHNSNNNSSSKSSSLKVFLTIFSMIIILSLITFIFVLKANVNIKTTAEELSKDFEVTFDPNVIDVSIDNRVIPSVVDTVSASVEGTYEATGSQVGGTKASGEITIRNNTSAPQQLVANTRLKSTQGKQFRLSNAVNLPAQGVATANIVAEETGIAYNIPAGKLTIPGLEDNPIKFSSIYGELASPLTNGSTEDGIVVTDQDLIKARLDLQKKLTEVVNTQVSEREGKVALSIQSQLNDIQYEGLPSAGNKLRSFTVKATSSLDGVFYKQEDLDEVIKSLLSTQVLESQELAENPKINFDNPQSFPDRQAVKTRIYVDYKIKPKLDIENISKNIRFRTLSQTTSYLNDLKSIEEVDLNMTPGFSPILPLFISRININVE